MGITAKRTKVTAPRYESRWVFIITALAIIALIISVVIPTLQISPAALEDGGGEVVRETPSGYRSNTKAITSWMTTASGCTVTWQIFISQFLPDERWAPGLGPFEETSEDACSPDVVETLLNIIKGKVAKYALGVLYGEMIVEQIAKLK